SLLPIPGIALYCSGLRVLMAVLPARRRWIGRQALASLVAVLWLVGLFALAAYTQRAVAWWALGAPAFLAALPAPISEPRHAGSAANGAIEVVLSALIVIVLPIWRQADDLTGPKGLLTDAPAGITTQLKALPETKLRVFNPQRWGSWFELALPQARVFVDSRVEAIPPNVWFDELVVSEGRPDWWSVLDRWRVEAVVATATDQ